ncbi:protein ABHD11 isoform X2 [Cuculus canorus]|uniref:protein ABHD11 isoform X2 n=1 Tax=Cuculus canorus TaxID=55661 RepID=UPI0023AB12C9|nr:protein ABHD11 isoform X2 [Cuculus canorus]
MTGSHQVPGDTKHPPLRQRWWPRGWLGQPLPGGLGVPARLWGVLCPGLGRPCPGLGGFSARIWGVTARAGSGLAAPRPVSTQRGSRRAPGKVCSGGRAPGTAAPRDSEPPPPRSSGRGQSGAARRDQSGCTGVGALLPSARLTDRTGCRRGGARSRAVSLSYAEVGSGGARPPLVLLHGLFGSRVNFQSVANALVRRGCGRAGADAGCPEPRLQPPQPHDELRGDEPGCAAPPAPPAHPPVHRPGPQHGWQDCHGPGAAADLVERLISVDISPVSTACVSEFSAYIAAMKAVKIPDGVSRSAARQLADKQLQPVIQVPQIRQFLLTSLVDVQGRYVWRVNLEAISNHLADIMNFPMFHKPYPGPALFLRGSNSPYMSSKDYPEIRRLFPKANVQFIEGAGHIVHQDKFEEFITAVLNFLPPP